MPYGCCMQDCVWRLLYGYGAYVAGKRKSTEQQCRDAGEQVKTIELEKRGAGGRGVNRKSHRVNDGVCTHSLSKRGPGFTSFLAPFDALCGKARGNFYSLGANRGGGGAPSILRASVVFDDAFRCSARTPPKSARCAVLSFFFRRRLVVIRFTPFYW